MGCNILPSSVIPAVAARLKYYVGVQRKEVGFDASARQGETMDNYRLYQLSKSDAFHHNQRITKKFLDNQMEASLRLYYGRSDGELNENFQIDPERKRHMQRKIKNKMSSIIIPDSNTSNCVYPRRVYGIERSSSDMERIPSYPFDSSPPDMSPDEITRLISSAAELIVVTTSRKQRQWIPTFQTKKTSSSNRNNVHHLLPRRQMYKSDSCLKKKADPSHYSLCLKIPSSLQDSSPSSQQSPHCETTNSGSEEDTDVGVKMNQTENRSNKAYEEDTEYEISVHTGFNRKSETKQVLLIRLVGENGKTKKQALENSSTNPIPFCADQVDIFNLKTKDIGKLKHLEIRTKQKDTNCRFHCRDITVTKLKPGDEKYTFQCNQWISPIKTVVHLKEQTKTRASTGNVMPAPPADGRKSRRRKEKPQTPGAKIKQDKGGKDSSLKQKKKAEVSHGRREASKQMDPAVSRATSSKPKSEFIKSGGTAFTSQFIMKVCTKPEETKDCLMDKCPLGEKTSTEENHDSNLNEQIQETTQEVKGQGYRRASSPCSYVFFSREITGESSLIVEQSSGFPRDNTIIPNIPAKKELQESSKEDLETHWFDNNEQKDQASQMTELQQFIRKPVTKLIGVSVGPDSENMDSNLGELKKGDSQDTKDGSREKHQRFLLPQTPQISEDQVLEDGDENNYASDTTLDEEFLFSDWSMSLSENEEDSDGVFSKSESFASQPETRVRGRDLRRRVRNPIPKENKEVERNSSDVYQRALRSINSDNANLLRNLCRQHFFLPSCVDEQGRTLLHHASSHGNDEICQVLLDTAVGMMNLDKKDIYGKTALHYAALKNNDKTMKLLMKNGAK